MPVYDSDEASLHVSLWHYFLPGMEVQFVFLAEKVYYK